MRPTIPTDIVAMLRDHGIIEKLKEAGVVEKNVSVEDLLSKARKAEDARIIKDWYVICGDEGCLICATWDIS
jgi:hypothetical protein